MKLKIFIFILLFSLFLTETNYANSNAIKKKQDKVKTIKKSHKKGKLNKGKNCTINIQTKIPFKIDDLQKFFPDSVLNVAASPPSSGRREGKLNQITSCAVEYQLSRRTFFTLTITDYGSYDNIASDELRDYIVVPKEYGKTSEVYKIPCGDGFKMWHEPTSSGVISFLYCYRFVLKYEIINWNSSLPKFEEFVKYIDLNKLIEESKKKIELEKKPN